ncbi:MAG: 3-ketoacyl-ACP reductase [Oscillospiraceae bacterium]|nr:3-ketoacyl-ACP reductase [Oscillospiraceae bacterium]
MKTALITGASRGIGNAVAAQLAKEGYSIAAVGTSNEADISTNLENIKQYQTKFCYIQGNIASADDRKRIVESAINHFGGIDVLVNNAGVAPKIRTDLLEMTEESMDHVLGINLKGTFFLSQIVAKQMINRSNSPKIINISSISAYTSSTQRAEYCISKAAVSMMTTLFADRLAEFGIRVYEIRPGIIETDMTSKVKDKYDRLIDDGLTPIKRWGQPQDVADAVSVLCSGKLDFSTGEVINVDGGFHIRRL